MGMLKMVRGRLSGAQCASVAAFPFGMYCWGLSFCSPGFMGYEGFAHAGWIWRGSRCEARLCVFRKVRGVGSFDCLDPGCSACFLGF